jgi:uncharacterized membrane protein YkoI
LETAVKTILGAVSVALIAAMMLAAPAEAGKRKRKFQVWSQQSETYVDLQVGFADRRLAQSYDDSGEEFPVSESDAADIAQQEYPGARVLRVRLLPSGVYAVTLKEGGRVYRVRVNARTGAVR